MEATRSIYTEMRVKHVPTSPGTQSNCSDESYVGGSNPKKRKLEHKYNRSNVHIQDYLKKKPEKINVHIMRVLIPLMLQNIKHPDKPIKAKVKGLYDGGDIKDPNNNKTMLKKEMNEIFLYLRKEWLKDHPQYNSADTVQAVPAEESRSPVKQPEMSGHAPATLLQEPNTMHDEDHLEYSSDRTVQADSMEALTPPINQQDNSIELLIEKNHPQYNIADTVQAVSAEESRSPVKQPEMSGHAPATLLQEPNTMHDEDHLEYSSDRTVRADSMEALTAPINQQENSIELLIEKNHPQYNIADTVQAVSAEESRSPVKQPEMSGHAPATLLQEPNTMHDEDHLEYSSDRTVRADSMEALTAPINQQENSIELLIEVTNEMISTTDQNILMDMDSDLVVPQDNPEGLKYTEFVNDIRADLRPNLEKFLDTFSDRPDVLQCIETILYDLLVVEFVVSNGDKKMAEDLSRYCASFLHILRTASLLGHNDNPFERLDKFRRTLNAACRTTDNVSPESAEGQWHYDSNKKQLLKSDSSGCYVNILNLDKHFGFRLNSTGIPRSSEYISSEDEANARPELESHLDDLDYPCSMDDILDQLIGLLPDAEQ